MRRWSATWLWLAACYSPRAPAGAPCAPEGEGARCPPGQECVMRGGIEVCELPGAGPDIGADATLDAPPIVGPDANPDTPWWDTAFGFRQAAVVTAGETGAPAGYSFAVTFDHKALVVAGASLASGDDVRIVRDDGTEVDRVLDSGSAFNDGATKLWFKHGPAIAADGSVAYFIYYGNPAAGPPPANAANVFLLSDGFEGSLAAWDLDPGVNSSTLRAHRGQRSIRVSATEFNSIGITAKSIDERDVAFDAWWNIEVPADIDASQGIRGDGNLIYFTNLQPPLGVGGPPTWDIAKYNRANDVYAELVVPGSTASPPANTWVRVTVYGFENKMAIDIDGQRYTPATGFATIDGMSSGTVRIDSYHSDGRVFFDDATLRRFVLPEPVVAIGAQQAKP